MNTKEVVEHDHDIPALIAYGKPFEILQDKYYPLDLRRDYAYYPEYLTGQIISEHSVAVFKVTPKINQNVLPIS